jgi:hypothetical protein
VVGVPAIRQRVQDPRVDNDHGRTLPAKPFG